MFAGNDPKWRTHTHRVIHEEIIYSNNGQIFQFCADTGQKVCKYLGKLSRSKLHCSKRKANKNRVT